MASSSTYVDPLNILVVGETGAGKSTIVNLLTSARLPVSNMSNSCTQKIEVAPTQHQGRLVNYFDAPGFDDSNLGSGQILAQISSFASDLYESAGRNPNIHGILYIHSIANVRTGWTATNNLRMLEGLLGQNAVRNLVFVTNMWDGDEDPAQSGREQQLMNEDQYFGTAIGGGARGGYRIRRGATEEQARNVLSDLFLNSVPVTLQIQDEQVNKNLALWDTAAGQWVYEGVKKVIVGLEEFIRGLGRKLLTLVKGETKRREWFEFEKKDAEANLKRAKEQEGILQLTLDGIRKHPRLSALLSLAVVGAAGILVLSSGHWAIVAKAVVEIKGAVSGTAAAAAATASTTAGTHTVTTTGVGTESGIISAGVACVSLVVGGVTITVGMIKQRSQEKKAV